MHIRFAGFSAGFPQCGKAVENSVENSGLFHKISATAEKLWKTLCVACGKAVENRVQDFGSATGMGSSCREKNPNTKYPTV
jgi:hypothetical protein